MRSTDRLNSSRGLGTGLMKLVALLLRSMSCAKLNDPVIQSVLCCTVNGHWIVCSAPLDVCSWFHDLRIKSALNLRNLLARCLGMKGVLSRRIQELMKSAVPVDLNKKRWNDEHGGITAGESSDFTHLLHMIGVDIDKDGRNECLCAPCCCCCYMFDKWISESLGFEVHGREYEANISNLPMEGGSFS